MGSESEAGAAPAPSLLDALPQHLLNAVFCEVLRLHQDALRDCGEEQLIDTRKRDPRRVLPLVSRGFLSAAAEAEGLWRHLQLNLLTLSAERVPLFVRWLSAHASAIRSLVLYGRALPTVEAALWEQLGPLVAAVQQTGAARLERLDLPRSLSVAVLARLDPEQLLSLRSVGVDLASSRSSARDAGMASSSSSGGGGSGSAGSRGGETGQAPSVRQRRRAAASSGLLSEAELATANLLLLPALSELLVQSCLEARVLAAHPGGWRSRLQRLHFADVRDVPRGDVLPPLASLQGLTSLRFYQRDGFRLPGPLTALRHSLAHLHAAVRYQDDPLVVEDSLACLSGLRALWLQHATFEAPASLASLPRLHTLALVGCASSWAPVLEGMAAGAGEAGAEEPAPAADHDGGGSSSSINRHTTTTTTTSSSSSSSSSNFPQLRALHLEAHATSVAEVPVEAWQALAGLGGGGSLTRLELPYCRLTELPPGPYLSALQVLDLSQNSLSHVPPTLAACHHLASLSLGQQEAGAPGEDDAELALLCTLPALRLLVASAGHYSGAHLAVGLRSPAEAAHLERLRAGLPRRLRVTNRQGEWERAAGRLAALFEVSLRRERL